jgi:hypothetical protein
MERLVMAPIALAEVEPGLVAFLDRAQLNGNGTIAKTGSVLSSNDERLLVCLEVAGDSSTWTPLTTEWRRERLYIDPNWRTGGDPVCSGGFPQWLLVDQFLQDGANTYQGPTTAFVAASWRECTEASSRSRLTQDGIMAIKAEVIAQRRRALPAR